MRAPGNPAFPRERARARPRASVRASERQPAPKSAPVSQGNKRRGGSPAPDIALHTRAKRCVLYRSRSDTYSGQIDRQHSLSVIVARKSTRNLRKMRAIREDFGKRPTVELLPRLAWRFFSFSTVIELPSCSGRDILIVVFDRSSQDDFCRS